MALRDYPGNDNYGKPRQNYLDKIAKMTDEQLHEETKSKIWLSAYAMNNPRSDYHWMVDALYDEWEENREDKDGYSKAYDEVYEENFG